MQGVQTFQYNKKLHDQNTKIELIFKLFMNLKKSSLDCQRSTKSEFLYIKKRFQRSKKKRKNTLRKGK